MLRISLWLLIFLALPLSAAAQVNRQLPPGQVQAGRTINDQSQSIEPPMEMRNKRFDVQAVKQEADELRALADALPAEINQVANNQLPKDLSDNLKKIERLAKHLRSEVVP